MTRAVIVAAVVATAAPAAADPFDRVQGAASLEYEASYVHAFERDAARPAPDGLGLAGARLRGQIGKSWLNYRVGLDLRAGATAPGGFAYDCDLYLAGAGILLGRWSRLGIVGGIGAAGATGTLDDVVQLPVEASLELGIGDHVRVLARGRLAWHAAARGRSDGAPSVGFADALDASLAIRLGDRKVQYGFPAGNGYYLGVAYREADGARMIGAVIGHSIDAGSRWR
jgi:hypothetical protein